MVKKKVASHEYVCRQNVPIKGSVKNLPLLRRVGNNGCPWVHATMYDNTYSDIIHASTL